VADVRRRLKRIEARVNPPALRLVSSEGLAGLVTTAPEQAALTPLGPGLASLLSPTEQATLPTDPLEHALAAYRLLRGQWRHDPVRYARERLGLHPTFQQETILRALTPDSAKVSVRSGHGVGKSSTLAAVIWWFLETVDFARIPCTGPSSHQLRDVLWAEVAKWRRSADTASQARGDHPRFWLSRLFEQTTERAYDRGAPDEWFAVARTSSKERPEALSGFHAAPGALLFIIEEASGVLEATYETAEGSLSSQGSRVLMVGNPTRNSGTFAASHKQHRSEYTSLHFRSQDSPLIDPAYRPRLVRKFGEHSNVVRVRADGEFPQQDDDVLISLELTEAALQHDRVPGIGPRRLGVDVARFGDDRTVLLLRQGPVVEHIAIYAKQDTMVTVGRVVQASHDWHVDEVYVDVIGVRAGVYDRLHELVTERTLTVPVYAVNVAEAAPARQAEEDAQGKSLRDHLWLMMWRWLREDAPVFAADHDMCEDLAGELSSVKYAPDSAGRIVVESKDAMKARHLRSSDIADALGVTFAPAAAGAIDVSPQEMEEIWRKAGLVAAGPADRGASYQESYGDWEDDPDA
jgi:phage terminase large subunit